jgi:predicted acetyltransferase
MKTQRLKLVLPSKKYLKSYQDFCRDFIKNGKNKKYRSAYQKTLEFSQEPGYMSEMLKRHTYIATGKSPMIDMYWAIVGNRVVGIIGLRHRLTKDLKNFGGHIGQDVAPTEQRKGYGSLMLQQILVKAKTIGIKKVLLTCKTHNIGSRKLIEKNGGKLDKIITHKGRKECLYWIKL